MKLPRGGTIYAVIATILVIAIQNDPGGKAHENGTCRTLVKAACLVLLFLILFPSASCPQSSFDDTWVVISGKIDKNENPNVFLVADGMYRSDGRVLKADGRDDEVPKTGYWDTVSVRIVDDHTVEVTSKKAGKPMFTETDTPKL